jgi:hypothetical protein
MTHAEDFCCHLLLFFVSSTVFVTVRSDSMDKSGVFSIFAKGVTSKYVLLFYFHGHGFWFRGVGLRRWT